MMRRHLWITTVMWAVTATALLIASVGWPGAIQGAVTSLAQPPLPNVPAAVYGGPALGFIVTLENGVRIYHAGSTPLTMDLQMYGRLYRPHVALLPIASGMMPDEAAMAAELLRADNPSLIAVFPQHHAAFMPPDRRGRASSTRSMPGRRCVGGCAHSIPNRGRCSS